MLPQTMRQMTVENEYNRASHGHSQIVFGAPVLVGRGEHIDFEGTWVVSTFTMG